MQLLLQYVQPHTVQHNVHAAAQCVEVSWTSAFLLPRALTDVLFLLFVPSALRGVQHVTICTFQFCKKAGTCPLVLGPKNWDGLGSAGGGLPSADYLASFDQLHSCTALLLSLSLILQQLRLSCCENKRETVKDCDRHSNTCKQPFFAKTCVQKG